MRRAAGFAAAIGLSLVADGARAEGQTTGVLIFPVHERDVALAENLSEVAMARIAETPGRKLVGTLELRRRGLAAVGDVQGCLAQPACLGQLAAAIGARRLVTGSVRSETDRFLLSLNLTDVGKGEIEARFSEQVASLPDLVRSVQVGVDQLLQGDTRLPPPAAAAVAGRQVELAALRAEEPRPRLWAPHVVYGSAVGAALCLSMGGLLGTLAEIAPSGSTREEVQRDQRRRLTYGRAANTVLAGGVLLSVVSAAALARYWRDLTGG